MDGQDTQATGAPPVVLFDFDGVLTHADTYALFVRERYARSAWRKLLALLALPWLLLLWPLTRRLQRPLVHIALLGMDERRYRATVEAFAAGLVRRPGHFCRDGVRALRRHQAAGERVIVVTGCEHTVVENLLSQLGLTGLELVASRLRPGAFGLRLAHHNVGAGKLKALATHGVPAWRRAYGDSLHDLHMLKAAAEPVLVNGTPKLCKRIERALGRSVERVAWH
ncbi:haloacid dehalogenase-like hydrolase [Frateuria hangzhouensis]|uniref:haloacid dehalogenase-like hydrolase n=1 Tax=Frateuria hangzhouensis TaxID=2995589 RepID=UPI00226089A5|nr:haloacid dehalogenase-like hydrolase [Frateuria sp. STR12]MCX7512839.1 haloacid dehalogenase-like hydrolase [Frateuria sp. STR12]